MLGTFWTQDELFGVLDERYELEGAFSAPQQNTTGTAMTWLVECVDDHAVRVTQYLDRMTLPAAACALDMSEYCRAAGLLVPRVHADAAGHLLSDGGLHGVCSVTEVAGGTPITRPYTLHQARHLGLGLGQMHDVLPCFPLPSPAPGHEESAWAALTMEQALALHEAAAWSAVSRGARDSQIAGPLQAIRECLPRHLAELREAVSRYGELTAHAIHGAYLPPYVRATVAKPVVTNFQARHGYLCWEAGRAAFEVRTVAEGEEWQECAIEFLSAYRRAYPDFPERELAACSRVALLEFLCTPVSSALPSAWEQRATAVGRLLEALPELDEAFGRLDAPPRRAA
ncbi:hypothetical protein ACFWPU_30465 [Streptomyces sp. NPDC058471]|uniref:hypothetical protein n=1 Tax=Streptomyces sp. NPDC058471 TaxID=3346516 RepID=UPI00364B2A5C